MKTFNSNLVLSLSLYILQLFGFSTCEYSKEEALAIEQLRNAVDSDLYEDFMRKDEYLLPWLKARNMNVERAADMLANSLKWRRDNKIDSIIDQKALKCDTVYPTGFDTFDKEGRPIYQMNMGDWDVRKQMLAGRRRQFFLCTMRMIEIQQSRIRKQQDNEITKNVTQWSLLIDLKGYNLRQHACIGCISAYVNTIIAYEANFPVSVHEFYLVNTPTFFEAFFQIAKAAMTESTRKAFNVYGFNQVQWKAALLQKIPEDQLTPFYGGTRKAAGPSG